MSDLSLSRRPSTGTVLGLAALAISLVALSISLSGLAGAAPRKVIVKKGDIAPGAVTAKAIAKGAVHANALAKGAVKSKSIASGAVIARTIKAGAVIASTIGPDAVTTPAIAPGSIHGYQLGPESIQTATMPDADTVAADPDWTAGDNGVARCAPNAAFMGGGFNTTELGNREVTWLQATPFISPATGSGMNGRFASDSGGTAEGQIMVVCLN